jgi:hypothetical protein
MVERLRELAGGAPDFVLHTAQSNSTFPDPVKIVNGDAHRVLSFADLTKMTGRVGSQLKQRFSQTSDLAGCADNCGRVWS